MYQIKRFIQIAFVFYVFIALVHWFFTRPHHINWGATAGGVNMKLPVGELISSNRIDSTRAINIKAAKEKVWPRITQTGQNQGGFNG